MFRPALAVLTIMSVAMPATAELSLCSLFTDHMVVQRDLPIRIWGWAEPSTEVSVTMGQETKQAESDENGRFDVELDARPAGGTHQITVRAGNDSNTIQDVLIGEVWICSGQSNMQWAVSQSDDADLESLAADFPEIRLISVPQVGTQEPQRDFEGNWTRCSPVTVKDFSAVGYFFGRQLHQTLDVPIGLIDNAWGGSAAEAWVRRDVLESAGDYQPMLKRWDDMAANYDEAKATAKYEAQRKKWIEGGRKGRGPRTPGSELRGNHRPSNIYNGVLKPTIGYGIRGAIWYQGESNAERAYEYRDLFPLMIRSWRDEWNQGDFPFYWVQLADFKQEAESPGDSSWAELREAQTMTADKLPATGQAVIIDLGESSDIHPRNKQDVAKRLARLALHDQYGFDIVHQSPRYESMSVERGKAIVKFKNVGRGLDTFDVNQMIGFTIAGEDRNFVPAEAKLVSGTNDTVEVSSPEVASPVAVRYAWADNPVANVQNKTGLPLTPFRTDDFRGVTQKP